MDATKRRPSETCQLCGKQELRYHFEIGNAYTNDRLWVGSHCILQFDVDVLEDGRRLSTTEAKRHLTKLTQLQYPEVPSAGDPDDAITPVTKVDAQLKALRTALDEASRKTRQANTLWAACRDYALQHRIDENTFQLEGTPHGQ